MMGRPWTAEEESLVKAYWKNGSTQKEIAEKLGRTKGAIRAKIYYMKYPEKYNRPRNTGAPWTDREIRLLKGYWKAGFSVKRIARELKRSEPAILDKVHLLRCSEEQPQRKREIREYTKPTTKPQKPTICWNCARAYANRCTWMATGDEKQILALGGSYEKQVWPNEEGYTDETVCVIECPNYVPDRVRKKADICI